MTFTAPPSARRATKCRCNLSTRRQSRQPLQRRQPAHPPHRPRPSRRPSGKILSRRRGAPLRPPRRQQATTRCVPVCGGDDVREDAQTAKCRSTNRRACANFWSRGPSRSSPSAVCRSHCTSFRTAGQRETRRHHGKAPRNRRLRRKRIRMRHSRRADRHSPWAGLNRRPSPHPGRRRWPPQCRAQRRTRRRTWPQLQPQAETPAGHRRRIPNPRQRPQQRPRRALPRLSLPMPVRVPRRPSRRRRHPHRSRYRRMPPIPPAHCHRVCRPQRHRRRRRRQRPQR